MSHQAAPPPKSTTTASAAAMSAILRDLAGAAWPISSSGAAAIACGDRPNTRTGRAMFLTCCSPRSAKASGSLSRTWSQAMSETHRPPGSQIDSRRAAMLTPSPKMSLPSMMMSPTLMPARNTMRLSSGVSALRASILRCTVTAQATAFTTLGNSTSNPSPVVLTMRPPCAAIAGSTASLRAALSARSVPTSSAPISRL